MNSSKAAKTSQDVSGCIQSARSYSLYFSHVDSTRAKTGHVAARVRESPPELNGLRTDGPVFSTV